MKTIYAQSPNEVKTLGTAALRENFLLEEIFKAGEIKLTFSAYDRVIVGGAMPQKEPLELEKTCGLKDITASEYALKNRELGAFNIGADGYVTFEDAFGAAKRLDVPNLSAVYIGKGCKNVAFCALGDAAPKFYILMAPAHAEYPSVAVGMDGAIKIEVGSDKDANKRTLHQYIHPDTVKACQVCMGFTKLDVGSVWSSMPPHTHERRMEAYLYYDMTDKDIVVHFMGEPSETRHIVVENEQAVISPSWSIHSGVGTKNYAFVWSMAGENREFTDAKSIKNIDLK